MDYNTEEKKSKQRAIELLETGDIKKIPVGTAKGLRQIHKYLFQDVFDFAGEVRKKDIAKGNFRFAPALYLDRVLKVVEKMPETTFDEIVQKYVEMNVAHPFMEGNGRAMRIWLDQILTNSLGKCVDWSKIEPEAYLSAMERSPVNPLEIKTLLKGALTSKINDREVYMRGIQSSYQYEGEDAYDVHQLFEESK